MSNHSIAPWTFEGGEWIIGSKGERIAQVYNWHTGYLDNGQLMSSAPTLLKALEGMQKALEVALRAAPSAEVNVMDAFIIVGAREQAKKAIEEAIKE